MSDEHIFKDLNEYPPETTCQEICDDIHATLFMYGVKIVRKEPVPKQEEHVEDYR